MKVSWQLTTPVALFVFNRPKHTAAVLSRIAEARPPILFVIADGARPDRPGEVELCAEARRLAQAVDWPCEVRTDFSPVNLGCGKRISSGLNWVFDQVGEAIFVEDDTMPEPSFFRFCEEMLVRYRDNERILTVCGSNFLKSWSRTSYSYMYSLYHHVWGWAGWRRTMRNYDLSMSLWPEVRDGGWLNDLFLDKREAEFWSRRFNRVWEGTVDSWGYPYQLSCWLAGGLAVVPRVNLVSNIGFGDSATHTTITTSYANLPTAPIDFPLRHPSFIIRDAQADELTFKRRFLAETPPIALRALNKLRRTFNGVRA